MFVIKRHGVRAGDPKTHLSANQLRLISGDSAPIRVYEAPTGAGKTFGFLKAAASGQKVMIVVPTQALAEDLIQKCRKEYPHMLRDKWDSTQWKGLDEGKTPWSPRRLMLNQISSRGGLIVTTLETLALLSLGQPTRARITLSPAHILAFDHLVIDEAHTLNERALGFIHLWAALIGYQVTRNGYKIRLTLLSATHSNFVEGLADDVRIPRAWVEHLIEEVIETPEAGWRVIHGDVPIHLDRRTLLEVAREQLPSLLKTHRCILLIYDRLDQFSREAPAIRAIAKSCGLDPDNEVWSINGQDKHLQYSAGSERFPGGLTAQPQTRIIVGTSAIEMGMNIAGATALITDPGHDAAALLQRIGRVARGDIQGVVWVTRGGDQNSRGRNCSHLERLASLTGEVIIAQVQGSLAVSPSNGAKRVLRSVNVGRMKVLGGAYFSMLRRREPPLYQAFQSIMDELLHKEEIREGASKSTRLLDALHGKTPKKPLQNGVYRSAYKSWLKAIDHELIDLRGFLPDVRLRFEEGSVFRYSRDWVERCLRPADDIQDDVLIYYQPRDACMVDQSKPIQVTYLMPFGEGKVTLTGYGQGQMFKEYSAHIHRMCPRSGGDFELVTRFIDATGLMPRKITMSEHSESRIE